ncbi:MAG TPA: hypothetical protein VGR61_05360 [Candidatus Dormibacteraeota bacterium]|nr:hypothetical protein [Candidatus Dormibacteraeota bacterium]
MQATPEKREDPRLDEKMLRERLGSLEADQKRIGAITEERTKLKAAEVRDLFLVQQTKDVAFAVSCGIIDEVRDVVVPAGAPVLSLVSQR